MDRKPRRIDHERIIYLTVDFAINVVKNIVRGLFSEIEKKIDTVNSKNEIIETSKDLMVRIYLPEASKDDICVDLSEKNLEVSFKAHKGRNKKIREIKLPKSIVVEESTAELEDGLLTVKMPKEVKRIKYKV